MQNAAASLAAAVDATLDTLRENTQQCQASSGVNMEAFETDDILKDMGIKMPQSQLKLTYVTTGGESIKVTPGKVLTPTQVQNQPKVEWNAEPGAYYLLIMNDPDAESRANPQYREWHHWMVGNIPGCDIDSGEVLSVYIGSGPPKDTGLHRYVFQIYKQAGKADFSSITHKGFSPDGRTCQRSTVIPNQFGMTGPVAGNYFQAEYDDYVLQINAKFAAKK